MRKFLSLLLLFWLVSNLAFGDRFMGLDLEEFHLDNRLKVILVKRDIFPIVSVQVWFRVGASSEMDGKSGIAHFLEHMVFKGTKNLKPGEFSRIIKSLGGEDNAVTSWDYTMYYVNVPSQHIVKVLEILKEIVFDVVFDEKEFNNEKKVILEERRMRYEDDPFGQFFEDFLYNSFKRINYRRPVIGWEEDIRKLRVEDLVEFYNSFYSPVNAILVIVGNIDKAYVKREIKRIFEVSSKNLTQQKERAENITEFGTGKVEFKTERKDANSKAIIVGFRTPSYRLAPKDVASLEVLSYILADGRGARLYRDLVVKKKVASSISGGIMVGKYPFLTYFMVVSNPGVSLDKIKEDFLTSLNSIIAEGVTPEEIKVAKKKIKADRMYDFEKNRGIAFSLGWSEVVLGNFRELENFIKLVEDVEIGEVLEVFRKYFFEDNMVIGFLVN